MRVICDRKTNQIHLFIPRKKFHNYLQPSPLHCGVIFVAILGDFQTTFHIVNFYSVLVFIMEHDTDLKAEESCFRSVFNHKVFNVCEHYTIAQHRATYHLPCISFQCHRHFTPLYIQFQSDTDI
jgi:hypothetical protein